MAATRKLLAEIQQTLKKVEEGVLLFDDIWEKVYAAGPQALKEKYEGDLKKEIKKLQRLRDQIKTWIGSNEVKDKSSLMEARKTIETKMEQFKVCEKDTKTKAFSKEGLARQAILDPTEVAKEEKRTWINECLDQLNDVINTIEAEKEKLSYAKGNKSKNKEQLMFAENRVQKNKWHINKLEHILKLMDNGLDPIMLDSIKDSLDYYIESAADDDGAVGVEDEYDIYEDLEIDFDAFDVTGSTVPARGASSGSASADASPSSIDNITATPDISAAPGNGAAPAKSAAASTVQSLATRASPVKASAASTAGPVVSIRTQASVPAQTKAGTDRKGVAPTVASTGVAPTSTIAASIEACPVPAPAPVPTPVPTPGETTTPAPVSWAHAASVPQASTASAKASTTSQSPPLSAPQASSPLSAASQGVAASSAASLQQLPVPNTAQPAVPAQPSSPYNGDRGAAAPESSSKLTPVEAPVSVSAVDVTPSVTTPSPSVPSASSSVVTQPSNPPQQKLNPGTNSQINPDMMAAMNMLKLSMVNLPCIDVEKASGYTPKTYYGQTHSSYPSTPLYPMPTSAANSDNSSQALLFEKLPMDSLFFAFYFQQGTYQQHLAARELKKQSWRFHKKYMTWFQRHEEPKIATEDFEDGTYVYFDYESGWCQRIKSEFKFEYAYLEG